LKALALGLLLALASAVAAHDERRSGYEFMSRESQAMQDDDTANPAMLWVLDGEALWKSAPAPGVPACASCHAEMNGVAARYPAYDSRLKRPVSLEQRINMCRTGKQHAAPFAYESKELLSLSAYIARQSRGLPIAVGTDGARRPFVDAGKALYERRMGQLNMSCAQCHDEHWGRRLAGSVIPQAHPTGYPLYRLEWQTLGSLERRLRNCLIGIRATPYDYGAPELVDLELYLMARARGMKIDAPALRP
jgi:sulfur-oxidizing protein SoxA